MNFIICAIVLFEILLKNVRCSQTLIEFINLLNLDHLDTMKYDSLSYEINGENLDEDLDILLEVVKNKDIFFTTTVEDNCAGFNPRLTTFEIFEKMENSSCKNSPGRFIQDPCESYLLFVQEDYFNEFYFYDQVKCHFKHQPIVHILVEKNPTEFHLLEAQIYSERLILIATWNGKSFVR